MTKFMPADFKLIEPASRRSRTCTTSGSPASSATRFGARFAFVSQVNRATSETLRLQATQEGLCLKAWIKNALDYVIQVCMNEPGLEFVWVGDDAIDPLQQAQTLKSSSPPASRRARGARRPPPPPHRETTSNSGAREQKREHFLDSLRRLWHVRLEWENGAGGGEAADDPLLPIPKIFCLPMRPRPTGALTIRNSRSLHVRSRSLPAALQGRPRPAPRLRRRDGGDADRTGRFSITPRASPISSNGRRKRWPRAAASRSARFAPCMGPSPPAN